MTDTNPGAAVRAYDHLERIMAAADGRPLTNAQRVDFEKSFDEFSKAAVEQSRTGITELQAAVKAAARSDPAAAFAAATRYVNAPQPTLAAGRDQPYRRPGAGTWVNESGLVKTLTPSDRLSDHVEPDGLTMNAFLKGIVTGDWRGVDPQVKAMSLTTTAGGFLVPDPLSANVIDRARNATRVIQAGATTVPMTENKMLIARVATDPTAGWKTENAAITASDMVLEQVTLTSHTLVALVKASVELIEDARQVEQTIENALGAALAIELDRAALRGSGTAPEPRGILNTSGVNTQTSGTNGSVIASYAFLSTAVQTVQQNNGEPDGVIYAPRTSGELDRLVDTTNQPLRPPPSVAKLPAFVTAQIGITDTVGTSTDCSTAYVGQWPELLIGVRTNLTVEVSRQASDATNSAFSNLQVWIRAYLRADVAVAQPSHFVVVTGLR